MTRFSRRDWLKYGGLFASSLVHPPLLVACSSSGGPRTNADAGDAGYTPFEFDPDEPWWLQYNYRPVAEESTEESLEVEGKIPAELDGLYMRNGSNPSSGDTVHWFLGDGMLHGVRLRDGKAVWYRNRYVQTELLKEPPPPGTLAPPTLSSNASNVSLVQHAGRVLTLGEVGLPYEVSPSDLSTKGVYSFDGSLMTNMTAHPKVDHVTGELIFFGYDFAPPYLTYHRADSSGALVQSEPIELPGSAMMHDFQITATRVVFMDLPILFDLQLAIDNQFPFRWFDDHASRIGIMPRDGTNADIKWIEVDSCFIFHTMNAYDDPGDPNVVVLEAARHPAGLWKTGPNDFASRPSLYRYRINVVAGTVTQEQLDDRLLEFPQFDRRLSGLPQRYGYGLWLKDPSGAQNPEGIRGVLKYDLEGGATTAHSIAEYEHADEAIFVPRSPDAGEDEGYLLFFMYDGMADRTSLVILDAQDVEAAPLARVHLPVRVPFGFHGIWVPA